MSDSDLRLDFLSWLESKEGLPYCWPCKENNYSGKDLKIALYKDCYDCSGLVNAGIWHVTKGRIDNRANWSAQAMFDKLEPVTRPEPGDLAFYGANDGRIDHVMVVVGDGRVYGACKGGRKVTSPDIARSLGARVMYRPNVNYRKDFRGYRKLKIT